jgi:hypothetical protein
MGTGVSFPEVKWPELEADHSPQFIAGFKKGVIIPPLPHIFMKVKQ